MAAGLGARNNTPALQRASMGGSGLDMRWQHATCILQWALSTRVSSLRPRASHQPRPVCLEGEIEQPLARCRLALGPHTLPACCRDTVSHFCGGQTGKSARKCLWSSTGAPHLQTLGATRIRVRQREHSNTSAMSTHTTWCSVSTHGIMSTPTSACHGGSPHHQAAHTTTHHPGSLGT